MGRFGFVAKRLLQTIPMLVGIVFVVFLLLKLTPGDPARNVAGLRASQEVLAQVRHELGTDRPVWVQYANYLGNVAHGNLGYSYKSREPVAAMIGGRIEVTAWLLATAIVMATIIAIPVAVLGALRRDRLIDHAIRVGGLLALSMPSFWVGVLLLLVVALPTGWFPVGGFGDRKSVV